MTKGKKHIAIINAIYPPDKGASGVNVAQLVRHLKGDFKITIITTDRNYIKGQEEHREEGIEKVTVHSKRFGNGQWARLLAAYRDGARLIRAAKKTKPDFFLLCTDPPLLNWHAAKMLKKEKVIFWTLDLYPEAFFAAGIIGSNNRISLKYLKRLKTIVPFALISLGAAQRKYIVKKFPHWDSPSFLLPCGTLESKLNTRTATSQRENEEERIVFGYFGNIGEAHSEKFILNLVSNSDPLRHLFYFNVFGKHAALIRKSLLAFPNVIFTEWLEEAGMSRIDIQIITLKKAWTHICVPSKAVSAISRGTPILYHGDKEGDIYKYYEKALWRIEDEDNFEEDIKNFFQKITKEAIFQKSKYALDYSVKIKEGYLKNVSLLKTFLTNE